MATYFYCPNPTPEARTLASSLGAMLLRKFDGLSLWQKRVRVDLREGDIILCWGATLPELEGVRVLNSLMAPQTDYDILSYLRNLGMACPSVLTPDTPLEKARRNGYLPRKFNHEGGNDLIGGVEGAPDYYVNMLSPLTEECRVHIFSRKFLKFGMKVPRDGFRTLYPSEEWRPEGRLVHPTIRAWHGGWALRYGDIKSAAVASYKSVAQSVMKNLHLEFATVDMGLYQGNVVILGVGLQPDLPDHSFIEAYYRWMTKWIAGEEDPVAVKVSASKVEFL